MPNPGTMMRVALSFPHRGLLHAGFTLRYKTTRRTPRARGLLAICSAATFAFNNASVRRGVLTGRSARRWRSRCRSACRCSFLPRSSPAGSATCSASRARRWRALAAGILHFVWGRYCNYRATRAIGTNLVAPIQQFNLIFTLCWRSGFWARNSRCSSSLASVWCCSARASPCAAPAEVGAQGLGREDHRHRRRAPRRRSSRNMPRASRSRCCQRPAMA